MLKIINGGKMPTRGTEFSACVDLYANADVVIGAGETVVIPLGVCLDLEAYAYNHYGQSISEMQAEGYSKPFIDFTWFKNNHYLQLMLRSSLGKKGIILPNGVGVIDMDYADEMCMIVHNPFTNKKERVEITNEHEHGVGCRHENPQGYKISKDDRIAQIMLCEHKSFLFGIESEVKRNGGFGSTGHE